MSQFIPVTEEKAQALDTEFGQAFYKNKETFVELYNVGMLNSKNDDIADAVEKLTNAYKDVKHKANKIVFISKSEVLIDEALAALGPWVVTSKVKRELRDLVKDGHFANGLVAFTSKNVGVLHELQDGEEGLVPVKVGNEKHFSRVEELVESLGDYFTDETDDVYTLTVDDVLGIDDSFIEDVHSRIPGL